MVQNTGLLAKGGDVKLGAWLEIPETQEQLDFEEAMQSYKNIKRTFEIGHERSNDPEDRHNKEFLLKRF